MDRHPSIRTRSALFSCAIIGVLSRCGSDPPPPNQQPLETQDADSGCSRPGDSYRVGMTKTSASGHFTVELADANPAPPGYGGNHWSLKIIDVNHAPVAGAQVGLTLRMPDHADHAMPGTVGIQTTDGTYDVTNLNLTMAGLYNITVEIAPTDTPSESVVFQFCVARKGG